MKARHFHYGVLRVDHAVYACTQHTVGVCSIRDWCWARLNHSRLCRCLLLSRLLTRLFPSSGLDGRLSCSTPVPWLTRTWFAHSYTEQLHASMVELTTTSHCAWVYTERRPVIDRWQDTRQSYRKLPPAAAAVLAAAVAAAPKPSSSL